MSQDKKKDSNVIGIGHNQSQNTFSQEQYSKLVNGLHRIYKYARQELRSVNKKHDSAFTGYWVGSSSGAEIKLKTHEKHEQRMGAKEKAQKFSDFCDQNIISVEKLAKDNSISLELPIETEEVDNE